MKDDDRRMVSAEALAAAHQRIEDNDTHPEWMTLFNWHRAEYDPDKTLAAMRVVLRNAEHDCDLPPDHDGECWFESGTADD